MNDSKPGARVLIYSHDTFGLGHLRRCRTLAHALVQNFKNLSVLILSGSPIVGSFDYRARVDFVRVPGVIKLRNGEYTPLTLHLDIEDMLGLRSSIIRHTAESFAPDLFIVDKEPLGLRGEVGTTLHDLKKSGTRLVLGLRDILDDPRSLAEEWARKGVVPALEELYDEIWVYGLPQICEPLAGLGLSRTILDKVIYTGYLPRRVPLAAAKAPRPEVTRRPYVLVTPGGGGDGEALVDWVLRAHEAKVDLPLAALIVFGPFMGLERRNDFAARAQKLANVETIVFDANMENLIDGAAGIVAMGGYNTFCEILSLNKRALIVPRTVPRLEQQIRATRASELGLVHMLDASDGQDTNLMARAIRALPDQPPPGEVNIPGLLAGVENLTRLVKPWLEGARQRLPGDNGRAMS